MRGIGKIMGASLTNQDTCMCVCLCVSVIVFGSLAASLALPPRPSFAPSLAVVNMPMSLFANVEVAALIFAYPTLNKRVQSNADTPNRNHT